MNRVIDHNTDFFELVDHVAETADISSRCVFSNKNEEEVLVTIAIPTYKRAVLLKKTIDSAINQKKTIPFDIIVVDNSADPSDETAELMEHYRTHKGISYYKNEINLGMGGNWNRCIFLSHSKWVVLLHDDDTIEPSFLQKTVPYLRKLNPAILQTRKYSKEGHPRKRRFKNIKRVGRLDMLFSHTIDVPSGIIYNRQAVLCAGGFNNEFFPSLDYCFHSVALFRHPVYILNEDLTFYRFSVNASQSIQIQEDWLIIGYYLVWQVLSKYGLSDWVIKPFLQIKTRRTWEIIENVWHSGLCIPQKIQSVEYSFVRRIISYTVVMSCVYFEKLIARMACMYKMAKQL